MSKLNKKALASWGTAVAVVGVVLVPVATQAATDTDNTVITATVDPTISMTTSGTLGITVTPGASAVESVYDDVVTISTNNTLGYTLALKDSDATLTLTKGSDTIAAHAGTSASPTALATNSWGWKVDNSDAAGTEFPLNAFNAGPSADVANSTSSTGLYAGITASDVVVRSTASTASNQVTNVWYGVRVDASKPNGNYTDTITYTATTK